MTAGRQLYANAKQLAFGEARQKTRVWVGGRGCGKSTMIGFVIAAKVQAMPRSRGFLAAATFKQIETKTWPGIEMSLNMMGMVEGTHYVVGIQPPKHFEKPRHRLRRYSDVVTFRNGSIIEFLSLDRPDNARGGSYDHGDIDEAALLKQEHWTKILLPAVRGNRHIYGHIHWHHMVGMYTSMPWKSSGLWILDYEEKARRSPDKYLYLTANAYDNLAILGEEGIERMREEMTHMEFEIEVMNRRVVKTEDAFYEGFDTEKHCYNPKHVYGESMEGRTVTLGATDINPDAFLEASFDFGGWFNCCTVYQENRANEERMVDALYVKGNQRVTDLVAKFCDRFASHKHKFVRLWGEPRGHDRNAMMQDTVYDLITKEFRKRGWAAQTMAAAKASRQHVERQAYMTTILAEDTRGYPRLRINQEACKWTILAIQSTQKMTDGRKDKSSEKDRNHPQEQATHVTDTIDYYFDQKWGPRLSTIGRSTVGTAGSVDFY